MVCRTPLISPYFGPKRLAKMMPMATRLAAYGSRMPTRQPVAPRSRAPSSAARSIAMMSCGTLESRKMLIVFVSAFQNCASAKSSLKLSRPMKSGSSLPASHLNSETYAV
jgi:hypothetical protein